MLCSLLDCSLYVYVKTTEKSKSVTLRQSCRPIVSVWARFIAQGRARCAFFRLHVRRLSNFTCRCSRGAVGIFRIMSKGNPLKSVISIGNVDDTSLAMPSVNQNRSAQQRVLEQVQSMKRTKSKSSTSSRSGSTTLSPTSKISHYTQRTDTALDT